LLNNGEKIEEIEYIRNIIINKKNDLVEPKNISNTHFSDNISKNEKSKKSMEVLNNKKDINNNNILLMNNRDNKVPNFDKKNLGNTINDIILIFTFKNAQSFLVNCQTNEKLSAIIDRFEKTQCPNNLKQFLDVPFIGKQINTRQR